MIQLAAVKLFRRLFNGGDVQRDARRLGQVKRHRNEGIRRGFGVSDDDMIDIQRSGPGKNHLAVQQPIINAHEFNHEILPVGHRMVVLVEG